MSSYCRDRSIHLLRHYDRSAEPYYHSSSSGKRSCDCGYYSAAKDYYDCSTKPYHSSSDDDTDAALLAVGSVVCLTAASSRRLIGLRGFGVDWRRVCRRGRPVSKCRLRLSDRTKV